MEVCEWLVPITMYGDENKDGQITIQDKKKLCFFGWISDSIHVR